VKATTTIGEELQSAAAGTDSLSRAVNTEPESAESAFESAKSDDENTTNVGLSISEPDESIVLANHEKRPPPTSLLPPDQLSEARYRAFMASLFESEPINEDWALPMEASVYDILASQTIRVITLATHCRTAMCRIEMAVDTSNLNGMKFSDFMKALEPLWMGDTRLTAFIDTHRGNPPSPSSRSVNVEFWQAYLVRPEVERIVNDEVASWARAPLSYQATVGVGTLAYRPNLPKVSAAMIARVLIAA
jgi:hypothetical protein